IRDASRADIGEHHSAARGGGLRSMVRWGAGVESMRARRFDVYPVGQTRLRHHLPEKSFGCRGTANVAHTDEQNGYSLFSYHRSGHIPLLELMASQAE